MVQIVIKWSNQKFPIDVEDSTTAILLKSQIFSLTGVAPERQKIMVKGGMLKDGTELKSLGLKDNQQIMMMGTVGELIKEPVTKQVFAEDLTDAELSKAMKLPAGLTNLGNTCYLNASVQCLKMVSELPLAVQNSRLNISADSHDNFAVSLTGLVKELQSSGNPVTPFIFIQVLRTLFPQFAEQDRNGFMQQDAEECWGQIIHALNEKVSGFDADFNINKSVKFVDQFMTIEFLQETKCDSAPEEPASISVESVNRLRVNIGAGVSTYMVSEIGNGLVEKIEKNSPTTGSMAVYTKTSKISRLPQYLTVNFVRFQWKATERIKAKILKRVQFPFELDMTGFCTPDLMKKLEPAKNRLKEIAEAKAEKKKLKTHEEKEEIQVDSKTQKQLLTELGVDSSLINDPGVNPSGQYDLVAVLTHVGRGSNSGHYIGWSKQDNDTNNWWKFDDDKVTQIAQEDITKLEGGGDFHTAYIALYKAKKLE